MLAMVCGCSDRDPQRRRAIRGSVTLDGTPVEKGNIRFQADGPTGTSSGALINGGEYSIPAEKGLSPGKYKVMIFAPKPGTGESVGAVPGDPVPPAVEMIPAEYNVNSNKFIEVAEKDLYEFDFDIVAKKEP